MNNKRIITNKVLSFVFAITTIISLFLVIGASAATEILKINNVTVTEKSSSVTGTITDFNNDEIENSFTFHNVGDYVIYTINIKNNKSDEVLINTITDNNSNSYIEYEYDKHEGETISANGTLTFKVKATYKNELTDISKRDQAFSVKFLFDLTYNGQDESSSIDINPKTGDRLLISILLLVFSSLGLIASLIINKKEKTAKLIAIIGLLLTPFIIKAASYEYDIDLVSNYGLYDKQVVTITIGDESSTVIVPYNGFTSEPTVPSKLGYNFKGWEKENGEPFNFETPISSDTEVKAVYEAIKYDITYVLNDGTASNPTKYTIEDTVTLNAPTKNGYEFIGWTGTELTGPTKNVTFSGKTGARSYTANFTVINYEIHYHGLTEAEEQTLGNPDHYTIEQNVTIANPLDRIDSDGDVYERFTGWTYGDSTSTNVSIPQGSTGPRDFTANFVHVDPDTYTITYDLDGGAVSEANPDSYTIKSGEITLHNPTKEGYTFTGWTGTDLSGLTTTVTIPARSTGNRSYTANYSLDTYTISYTNLTPTEVSSFSLPEDYTYETNTFTLGTPSRDGYTFDGWTGSNGSTPGDVTINKGTTGNRTYTANFSLVDYDIDYTLNGGSITGTNPTTYNVETGVIVLINPSKEGYTFKGWSGTDLTGNENTSVTIPSGATGNRSYVANFDLIDYDITIDYAGGNATNPDTYTIESDSITLNEPVKEGYTFIGFTGTGLVTPTKTVVINSGSTGDRSYTANYEANKYNVIFDGNDSSVTGTMANQEHTYDSSLALTKNTYARTNYTFRGWNTRADGQGNHYDDEEVVTNLSTEEDITLYAEWEKAGITVTFNSMEGTSVSPVTLEVGDSLGDSLTNLPKPTKSGVVFGGWYEDLSDETTKVDLTYAPSDDVILYAKWIPFVCKKAITLNTESCNSPSGKGCRANGYNVGDTISYGNIIKSDTLTAGDALDCDVNGTGYNQRFYYVTDNGDNAVLISHITFSGAQGQSNINVYYNYDTSLTLLPTTEQWSNLPIKFEIQSGDFRPARMIRLEELQDMTGKSYTDLKKDGALNNYEFLFENSLYSGVGERSTAWLEQTVVDGTDTRIRYRNDSRKLEQLSADKYNSSNNCIKPIIEVPYELIDDSYIVTYDANGGTTSYTTQLVNRGSSLETLPTTTYSGRYLDGWYTDTSWTTKINASHIPSGYEKYYAKWFLDVNDADIDSTNLNIEVGTSSSLVINNIYDLEPISYSVEDDSVISINSDGDINALNIGTTKIIITGLLSGNTKEVNVTVSDVITTYNVEFDTQGGTPVPPVQVVVKNTEIGPLPSGITKTDYDFAGWYTTSSYTVEVTEHTIIDGDKVFYAKWVPSDAVAEINGSYFTSLQNAFNAVPINTNQTVSESDKTVIKVLKDFSFDKIDLTTDKSNNKIYRYVILDLNSHDLTVNSGNAFDSSIKFLEIKNGTITSNIDQGVVNVQSGATLYVTNASLINTNSRQGIYNNGGTVLIRDNSYIENKKDRAAVQNLNNGTLTILGGTIYSKEHNAVLNASGTVTIGKEDGAYDTSSIVIKSGVSTSTNNNQIGIYGNVNLYDGMIMGKKSAINNESNIKDTEDNAVKVKDTKEEDGFTYNRLYYTVTATTYRIDLDADGGDVDPTYVIININDPVGTLPTPTNGIYTFDGWYTEDDELVTSSRVPTGNETYKAKWSYTPSEDIVNYRTTNDAMTVYYNYINSWKDSSSNFPTWSSSNKSPNWSLDNTENAAMFNNFKDHNCICADNQCNTSGTVMCDKPKGYSTGFNEKVNVYLSDETKVVGPQVSYAKADNGTIYNLIPGEVYYWELDSDPNIHGYVRFTSERRILDGGDVRNLRDLGGLPVVDNNGNNIGKLAYGRLYRGIRLSSSNSVTELENLGINSQLDLREANSDSNKLSNYTRIEAQNYYVNPYNYDLNPNSTTLQEKNYYTMTRNAVKYAMEEIVAGKNLYFHCRIGTDRTGTVAYVLEGLLGVPEEDRVEDYELSFFYGLVRVHRYHNEKPGSSVGTGKERFVYMHNFMPTNEDIYDWYMKGSTNQAEDIALINQFRAAMIESN
ncbi:MAG: InlB B-repeat-containing protein [Bacilli bacterium]|nr:InlB B-repeat-containing protein [Bacilli bacterium]